MTASALVVNGQLVAKQAVPLLHPTAVRGLTVVLLATRTGCAAMPSEVR